MSEQVLPQVKLLVTYDVIPSLYDTYNRFVVGELVPAAQQMGLDIYGAWHTAYGAYPSHLACFVAESLEALETIIASEDWRELEMKLQRYTDNYSTKVVRFKASFQF